MIKSKNQNNSFQFIPKTINEQSKDHLKKVMLSFLMMK